MSDEERVIDCLTCGGAGGWEVVEGPDHVRGGAVTRWAVCHICHGAGFVCDEGAPVDGDDLDDWAAGA